MPEILPPVLINNGQNLIIPSLHESGNQIGPLFQTGTQGPAGPNIITELTQSDGTATISILGLTIEDSLILNGENYSYSANSLHAHRTALNIDRLNNTSDADKPISTATQSALNSKSNVGHTHTASNITDFNVAASAAAPIQSVNTRVGAIVLTKSDVGLGNVDNISDADKPISTATQSALNNKSNVGHFHVANDITNFNTAASAAAPVQSVNTRGGNITLSKTDVGLGNVDNTSDLDKPISAATATALSGKVDKVAGKGLSDENYTSTEKSKLAGIASGAEVNVNADWSATSGDAEILNKPTLGSAAAANTTDFATAAQGELADSALQPQSVNYLGEYNNSADYTYGDVVVYGGILYIRVGEPNTGYPPGTLYWEEYKPEIGSPAYDLYIQTNLDNKTNAGHGHVISDIADLQDALDDKQDGGNYATLVDGKVPSDQLPSYVDDVLEYADLLALPEIGSSGLIYVTLDTNKTYRWSGSVYIEISAGPSNSDAVPEGNTNLYYTDERASAAAPVQSVNGYTDVVTLNASDVGLGEVDNTSDIDKPISTATQDALDTKANLVDPVRTTLTGNGTLSTFAISGADNLVNPSALIVAIDGILQEPSVDYTVASGNITFTSPLPSGSKAVVISPTNTLQVTNMIPADGSVTSAKLAPNLQNLTLISPSLTSPIIQNLSASGVDTSSLGLIRSTIASPSPPAAFFDDFLGNVTSDLNWEISSIGGSDGTGPIGATNAFGLIQINATVNTFRGRILRAGPTLVDGAIVEACFSIPNFDNMSVSLGVQRPAAGADVGVVAATSINGGQWSFLNGSGSNTLITASVPLNGDFITGKKYRVRIEYKSTTLVNVVILESDAGLANWSTVFSGDVITPTQDRGGGVASHGTPRFGCSAGSVGTRSMIVDWFRYHNPLNIR